MKKICIEEREKRNVLGMGGVRGGRFDCLYICFIYNFFSDIAEKIYFCKKKRHQNQNTEKKLCKRKNSKYSGSVKIVLVYSVIFPTFLRYTYIFLILSLVLLLHFFHSYFNIL